MNPRRITLNRARIRFLVEHWDDEKLSTDIAFEIGCIRQELESIWKTWKREHPIKALFKSNRQKMVLCLKDAAHVFGEKTFWERTQRTMRGTCFSAGTLSFSRYRYYSCLKQLWPLDNDFA